MKRSVLRVSRLLSVLAVAGMLWLPAQGFGASPDSIVSGDIKEADGTTGQDTNSGSGIKTGHIQDGAVTDDKITGPISAAKIENGVFQKRPANVIVVAKSGGDFTDPIEAINSITDASPTNPYIIKIYPGVYNLNGQLNMKSYVDIEGSGENTTQIKGYVNNSALIYGADNAEIRLLTVEVQGYWVPAGIWCSGTSPKISNVTVISTGSPTANYGIQLRTSSAALTNVTIYTNGRQNKGIDIYMCDNITLNNISVTAESNPALGEYPGSTGIVANTSKVQINNFDVKAIGPSPAGPGNNMGIFNYDSDVRLNNGTITTGDDGEGVNNSGTFTVIQNTTIYSPITVANPSDVNTKCLNSYDASFNQIICN